MFLNTIGKVSLPILIISLFVGKSQGCVGGGDPCGGFLGSSGICCNPYYCDGSADFGTGSCVCRDFGQACGGLISINCCPGMVCKNGGCVGDGAPGAGCNLNSDCSTNLCQGPPGHKICVTEAQYAYCTESNNPAPTWMNYNTPQAWLCCSNYVNADNQCENAPDGSPCTKGDYCASLSCYDYKCGKLPDGEPCNPYNPSQCASGQCNTEAVCGPPTKCTDNGNCPRTGICNTEGVCGHACSGNRTCSISNRPKIDLNTLINLRLNRVLPQALNNPPAVCNCTVATAN